MLSNKYKQIILPSFLNFQPQVSQSFPCNFYFIISFHYSSRKYIRKNKRDK